MRIHLDSAPVIYAVERIMPFSLSVEKRLSAASSFVTSHLKRMECRVLPIRRQDHLLIKAFDAFFADFVHEVVPITSEVFDRATIIRANTGFSTPDSIHLAAAVESGCDVFLTNDHRLDRFSELIVDSLQD